MMNSVIRFYVDLNNIKHRFYLPLTFEWQTIIMKNEESEPIKAEKCLQSRCKMSKLLAETQLQRHCETSFSVRVTLKVETCSGTWKLVF